ncbi:glutamate--tRNA ligase [Hansschlegelia zhihuaiae]|uniref:Glutamate--tRNA ligase n=1 Tax=Hansschlegelia zhihuaiae TaxID=405005 RepID=A0A4Q0MF02_9HYPH|nr:glutamate--tRNA ligase [Hansschlegelia zhihuaiae]RXF72061.1 glutamate--tRNA ligase [Hansschlegelia zhihuaiae]
MTVLRFAPSPTGFLHLGNARTLLLNAIIARKTGGRFVLRIDDTDAERVEERFVEAIRQDVAWLGLTPDFEVRQSERLALYEAALERLGERVYPAYETEEELDRARRLARASGRPPVYDRAALRLTPEKSALYEAEGRRPHWRFRLTGGRVGWSDGVRGQQEIDLSSLSDPVIRREDGAFLYVFTSVVDDVDLGVTDIVRGEDHVANSAVQLDMFAALGAEPPALAHHNLLTTADGAGLSKRQGSLSLRTFREEGIEPLAVAAYATLVGSSEAVHPVQSLDELAGLVELKKLSRAPARVDREELAALSTKVTHGLPYEAVAERLAALDVGGGEAFWATVRGNLRVVREAADWWRIATGDIAVPRLSGEDAALIRQAADLLPPAPWDDATWRAWTTAVSAVTGAKGRALFAPLRLALTGQSGGPELARLLPFIGRERALERLKDVR